MPLRAPRLSSVQAGAVDETPGATVELAVTGMTCSTCAVRIERRLGRLPGVTATVSHVTGKAHVRYDPATHTLGDLVSVIVALGFGATENPDATGTARGHEAALAVRAALCLPLAALVAVLAMVPAAQFAGWQWVALAATTPVVTWGCWPVHRGAVLAARHRSVTMDTLVALGVTVSFSWSVVALAVNHTGPSSMPGIDMAAMPGMAIGSRPGLPLYLDLPAVLTALVLVGRLLEAVARRRGTAAVRGLVEARIDEATVRSDSGERQIRADRLQVGDVVVVRTGEQVPVDGIAVEGRSALNLAALTGESVPVEVGPGDAVAGGAVNVGRLLLVRAERVGADTAAAQAGRLVAEAMAGKAAVARLADRVAAVFVPAVLAISAATVGGQLAFGRPLGSAVAAAVAVLVVSCPCALGLATPAALAAGIGRGAQLGLFIRGPRTLEATRAIDTVLLDKTGTVTTGNLTVSAVTCAAGVERAEALGMAGAVESTNAHPLAQAIAATARDETGGLPAATDPDDLPGLGATATVDGIQVLVGRLELLTAQGLHLPAELRAAHRDAVADGATAVLVGWSGQVQAVLRLTDRVRPSSAGAVERLHDLGLATVLLTGDNQGAADRVAGEVGIWRVIAGVLPEGKLAAVRELQALGRKVAMVGDGVNDAPALAAADLGIALGTGSDLAHASADVILRDADLNAAADAIVLARRTYTTIRQNLGWAFAYNVCMIPAAALGVLDPMVAGAAMGVSGLTVLLNAARLTRFAPAGGTRRPWPAPARPAASVPVPYVGAGRP